MQRRNAALPGELYFDAVISLGGQLLTDQSDHDSDLLPGGGRSQWRIGAHRHQGHCNANGNKAVSAGASGQVTQTVGVGITRID